METITLEELTATIPASGYLSAAVKLGGKKLVGIKPPTGTGAFEADTASLLFHVSTDDTTFSILRDVDGTARYVTVAEDNTYGHMDLPPAEHANYTSVKIGAYQSDYSTTVTQAANRTIKLIVEKVTG